MITDTLTSGQAGGGLPLAALTADLGQVAPVVAYAMAALAAGFPGLIGS